MSRSARFSVAIAINSFSGVPGGNHAGWLTESLSFALTLLRVATASTRASLMIAAVITRAGATNAMAPAPPVSSVSPRTTTPSTAATTGCDICRVGIDAVKGPARNADGPHATPPAAHRASRLLRANRITELRRGALRDLDAAFNTKRAPYCGTLFSHLFVYGNACATSLLVVHYHHSAAEGLRSAQRTADGARVRACGARGSLAAQRLPWKVSGISLRDRKPVIVANAVSADQAPLAQLVEQLTLNQRVRGSKP
jgi:hypothetical protein